MFTLPDGCTLSPIRDGDQPALVRHLDDPEIYATTLRIPSPYTRADADAFVALCFAPERLATGEFRLALRLPQGDELIGVFGVHPGSGFEAHRAEIGYWVARPYWGRGLATAGVRSLVRHVWERRPELLRLDALVFAGNLASARVLENNSFVREGCLRCSHRKDGRLIDSWVYASLRGG
jgi:ribosomal-protein-alanine N-acetyltransferase